MRIALVGYGKMGKLLEELTLKEGHSISKIINSKNSHEIHSITKENTDVAIEFSMPQMADFNVMALLDNSVPVISGTTGWNENLDRVKDYCLKKGGAFLHASNFSIGVNIFFELNKYLARMIQNYDQYVAEIEEIHHTEKLDAPSGTAITLASGLIDGHKRYKKWSLSAPINESELKIKSQRIPGVPGTHRIAYFSDIDDIKIEHIAHNRMGFATGALIAAKWIIGKKGIYSMGDILKRKD